MLSEKFARSSGEKETRTQIHKKTKKGFRISDLRLNLAVDHMDMQIQKLDRASASLAINFETMNEEARKILKEAASRAEQRNKQKPNTQRK